MKVDTIIGVRSMRRIIFVTKALWVGGIETALVNLLNNLDYKKYDVTLLVLHAELDMLEQINPNCRVLIIDRDKIYSFKEPYRYSRLYHITEKATHPSLLHKMMIWTIPMIKWIENRLYIYYVRKLMNSENFDTAIIYSDVIAETAVRAIKANKYLMFYHHGGMRHVYHDKIAYKKCEKIVAVSKKQAENLKRFIPQYAEKIIIIPNMTDVDGIRSKGRMPCKDTFDKSKINIVSVGRVSYEKGMDLAVNACAQLVADGIRNVQWWIVGDGPEMKRLKDLVLQLNMVNYVKLVGMKSNPYPYIVRANLYVQPSRFESFGLTIVEALILGRAVLSTNTDGAQEILGGDGNICDISISDLTKKCEDIILKQNFNSVDFDNIEKKYKMENERILSELEEVV